MRHGRILPADDDKIKSGAFAAHPAHKKFQLQSNIPLCTARFYIVQNVGKAGVSDSLGLPDTAKFFLILEMCIRDRVGRRSGGRTVDDGKLLNSPFTGSK